MDVPSSYYWDLSDSLLRHGILGIDGQKSTAFEPLYPLFLAFSRWLTRDDLYLVMILQIAISSIGAVYFYKLCVLLSNNHSVAWIGVLIYSFYPYFIRQSVSVIEIPLFTTLLIATAYYYCRPAGIKGSVYCGIAFGLTLLARAAAIPIWVFATAALIFRQRYANALMVAGCTIILILPLLARNYHLDGSLMFSRSGENLFVGNCQYSDKLLPAYSLDLLGNCDPEGKDRKVAEELLHATDSEIDAYYTRKAFEFVKEHPLRTLRLKVLNIAYFFHPRIVPIHSSGENTTFSVDNNGEIKIGNISSRSALAESLHAVSYSFIFLTALYGIYLRRKEVKRDLILYVIVLSFVLVGSIYFPSTRLRAPMDFVLMFYSACAVARWTRRA